MKSQAYTQRDDCRRVIAGDFKSRGPLSSASDSIPSETYLVNSTIHFNINIVSQLVVCEVCCHWNVSLLAESSLEEVPGTGTISLSSRHIW